jgi:hypothetical protein
MKKKKILRSAGGRTTYFQHRRWARCMPAASANTNMANFLSFDIYYIDL